MSFACVAASVPQIKPTRIHSNKSDGYHIRCSFWWDSSAGQHPLHISFDTGIMNMHLGIKRLAIYGSLTVSSDHSGRLPQRLSNSSQMAKNRWSEKFMLYRLSWDLCSQRRRCSAPSRFIVSTYRRSKLSSAAPRHSRSFLCWPKLSKPKSTIWSRA